MDAYDIALSCGPPSLAIALQIWGIPSDRMLEKYAIEEQEKTKVVDETRRRVEYSLKGVVALSSLMTSVVSFPAGAFALARLGGSGAFFTYMLMLVGTICLLAVIYFISGRSPYDLAVGRPLAPQKTVMRKYIPFMPTIFYPFTGTDILGWFVYAINGIIIFLSLSIYLIQYF